MVGGRGGGGRGLQPRMKFLSINFSDNASRPAELLKVVSLYPSYRTCAT